MASKRRRRLFSVKEELLRKSREAALAAVQVFNNPHITFKSEIFIVLMVIAWTYLLHAYYRDQEVEYRYSKMAGSRRRFDKTKNGAYKYWELERCLNDDACSLDHHCKNNLRFLIGLRHEIEHQMTTRLDDLLSARFQACCLNYNDAIKELFDDKYAIDRHLAFSLQFSALHEEQLDQLVSHEGLPKQIAKFIQGFDGPLSEEEFNNERYAYRVIFVPKLVNRKGQADRTIEFIKAGTEQAEEMNIAYAVIKDRERPMFRATEVVGKMNEKGHKDFRVHEHTQLWRAMDAKNPDNGYGLELGGQWFWYQNWVDVVEAHCKRNS